MFSTDEIVTVQWYEIKYTDAAGNTFTIERNSTEATFYIASIFNTPGNTITSITAIQ